MEDKEIGKIWRCVHTVGYGEPEADNAIMYLLEKLIMERILRDPMGSALRDFGIEQEDTLNG